MNRIIALLAALILMVSTASTAPQTGRIITITAGTAIRIATKRTLANSMLIIPLPGESAGNVYVLNANPQGTCNNGSAGTTFVASLAAATSSVPGASFTFPSNGSSVTQQGGFDVQFWCIDGAHSGDTVAVSWDAR